MFISSYTSIRYTRVVAIKKKLCWIYSCIYTFIVLVDNYDPPQPWPLYYRASSGTQAAFTELPRKDQFTAVLINSTAIFSDFSGAEKQ